MYGIVMYACTYDSGLKNKYLNFSEIHLIRGRTAFTLLYTDAFSGNVISLAAMYMADGLPMIVHIQ